MLLALVAVVAVACAGGAGGPRPPAGSPAVGLYDDLPACDAPPAGIDDPVLEALEVPEGLVVTDIAQVDPLLQVTGLIDATPLEIRQRYADDARLVHVEDEGFEVELLLDQGPDRVFIRATIRCRTGSVLSLIRAPGDAADALPVPGQL